MIPAAAVGVDLAEVRRLRRWWERYTGGELARVFTDAELAAAGSANDPGLRLAVSFAGKEACAKALGRGMVGLAWTELEIPVDGDAVCPRLAGAAARRAAAAGVGTWRGDWSVVRGGRLVLVRVVAWAGTDPPTPTDIDIDIEKEQSWQATSTPPSSSAPPSS